MPLQLQVQFNIVLYGILSGLLVGTLFDIYRLIRGFNVPQIIKYIEDILFWILCAIVVFIFLLYKNYAFLGPYVYLFIGIAAMLYFKLVSPYVIEVERFVGSRILKFIRRVIKIIIYPLKLVLSKMRIKNM